MSSSHTTDPAAAGSPVEPALLASADSVGSLHTGPIPADAAIWLVRHGETEWSRTGKHTGRTDVPLTPKGEEQARALAPMFAGLNPALVLSSPRTRAARTAELAGLSVDAVDDDLAEWDYGEYEGLTTPQIRETVPGWTLWTHFVPGGDSPASVAKRADRVLRRAMEAVGRGPVVLVAHGHICRVIGARWIGLTALDGGKFSLGTAAPSVLGSEHGTPVINGWNFPNPAG